MGRREGGVLFLKGRGNKTQCSVEYGNGKSGGLKGSCTKIRRFRIFRANTGSMVKFLFHSFCLRHEISVHSFCFPMGRMLNGIYLFARLYV